MSVSNYFKEKCSDGEQSRSFWQIVRPYMSHKGETHHEIMPCKDDNIIFNNYFITATDEIGITHDNNTAIIQAISTTDSHFPLNKGQLIILKSYFQV